MFTYHGPPCDCWRHCYQQEDFTDYLQYVRKIASIAANARSRTQGGFRDINEQNVAENLTLLVLDLKLQGLDSQAKVNAGLAMAQQVVENLFLADDSTRQLANHNLRVVVSVNHVNDYDFVLNFLHYIERQNLDTELMPRIGFDVGMNDELSMIETMWTKFATHSKQKLNIWQGDGVTNCISPFYNLGRLTDAITKRDSMPRSGYMQKVYQWTIDLHERLREALRLGVDAIMTNHPERILTVINEPEMIQQVRLANHDDNPFERFSASQFSARTSPTSFMARKQRSKRAQSSTYSGVISGLIDVFNSGMSFLREIPMFSFPRTSRLLRLKSRTNESLERSTTTTTVAVASSSSAPKSTTVKRPKRTSTTTTSTTTTVADTTTQESESESTTTGAPQEKSLGKQSDDDSSDNDDKNDDSDSDKDKSKDKDSKHDLSSDKTIVLQDGPKWYTSLITGVLLGLMKTVMPPPQ